MIVTLNRKGILNVDGIILKGGANTVPAEKWKPFANHPTIKILVDKGELEFDMYGKDVKAKDEVKLDQDHLQSMKVKEATDLVNLTIDKELLESWLKVEKRAGIKKAIESQLEKLAMPAKDMEQEIDQGAGLDPASASEELKPVEGND